jgi:uncharacterized membrane protein YhdT
MENQPMDDRPTIRAHKAQFAWQILVPFVVMAGLISAGAMIVVTGGTSQTSAWADVSVIWLLAPALFFALGLLVIVITIVYSMAKLLQVLPHYTGKAQGIFVLLSAGTRKIADGATRPLVWIQQARAVVKSIFRL